MAVSCFLSQSADDGYTPVDCDALQEGLEKSVTQVLARAAVFASIPWDEIKKLEFLVFENGVQSGTPVQIDIPIPGCCYLSFRPDMFRQSDAEEKQLMIDQAVARGLYRSIRMKLFPHETETLGGLLVSEGLSRAFVAELGYPYDKASLALDAKTLEDYAQGLKPYMNARGNSATYLFSKDIDNSGYNVVRYGVHTPQWGGYALATALARGWMVHNGTTAAQNLATRAEEVTQAWVSGQFALVAPEAALEDWGPVRPVHSVDMRPRFIMGKMFGA